MSAGGPESAVLWFRRDLRLGDHPALAAAGKRVLGVFVLDDRLLAPAGAARRIFLVRALRALRAQLAGRLLIVSGDPANVLPEIAEAAGATSVHVSARSGAQAGR